MTASESQEKKGRRMAQKMRLVYERVYSEPDHSEFIAEYDKSHDQLMQMLEDAPEHVREAVFGFLDCTWELHNRLLICSLDMD